MFSQGLPEQAELAPRVTGGVLLVQPRPLAGLRGQGLRVSKATIYNTLNLFAASGLIRQLSVGGDRSWFDSNTDAHYHFHDLDTGALVDVSLKDVEFQRLPGVPAGMQVDGIDLVIRLRRREA